MIDEPVEVYRASNSIEASGILLQLADIGIKGRMASSALELVSGAVPFQTIAIPILVHASDRERAVEEIQQRQKQQANNKQ